MHPAPPVANATILEAGWDDKVHPAAKLAVLVDMLAAEGVPKTLALRRVLTSAEELYSPATRISVNQAIEAYRNAMEFSSNPHFAYHTGLKFHVATYGMWGFAILSSMDFRQTMHFAVKYHQLAAPLAQVSFNEAGGRGVWTIDPLPHPRVDATLYRFIMELQFGTHISLHRDVMGPSFGPLELHVTFDAPGDAGTYQQVLGCRVFFRQSKNKLVFDASWLDRTPELGNEITNSAVLRLCDELLEDLQRRVGVAGKVREIVFPNLGRPTDVDSVAQRLGMTPRTLRRKLSEQRTSFRELLDEMRTHVAMKYLRDTTMTTEDIAFSLGFSDAANFRRAFRQWTSNTPNQFRQSSASEPAT